VPIKNNNNKQRPTSGVKKGINGASLRFQPISILFVEQNKQQQAETKICTDFCLLFSVRILIEWLFVLVFVS